MKSTAFTILVLVLFSCNQKPESTASLQDRIDSLKAKLNDTYKPGFGEFMSNVQIHHAKLWFAGKNENWQLADFEIKEIIETVEDIEKYETDRSETREIGMIKPALDSVSMAIEKKDAELFKTSFVKLTSTCNNCHRTTSFQFNVVKIPDTVPFSNQDFKPKQ